MSLPWNETWALARPASAEETRWRELGDELRQLHREPARRYHVVEHVEAVLGHLRDLDAAEPVNVFAAFFHDAIYDARASDNEPRSAELAVRRLAPLVWTATVTRVAETIRATAAHQPSADPQVDAFLDADLAILGAPADHYDWYAEAIRAEYDHLDDATFRAGRASVLGGFLARPQLFLTAAARDRWEAPARRNLARELAALR